MHRTDKYSQHSSVIWPVWLNSLVFVYEQSSCGIEFRCSLLNFRYRACFEQRVPWDSGNYRVCIHSEMRTWHDKSIQPVIDIFNLEIMQDSVYFFFFFFWFCKKQRVWENLFLQLWPKMLSTNQISVFFDQYFWKKPSDTLDFLKGCDHQGN